MKRGTFFGEGHTYSLAIVRCLQSTTSWQGGFCREWLPHISYYIYTREPHYPPPPNSRVPTSTNRRSSRITGNRAYKTSPHPPRVAVCSTVAGRPSPKKHRPPSHGYPYILGQQLPTFTGCSVRQYSVPPSITGTRAYKTSPHPPRVASAPQSRVAPHTNTAPLPTHGYPQYPTGSPAHNTPLPTSRVLQHLAGTRAYKTSPHAPRVASVPQPRVAILTSTPRPPLTGTPTS